MQQAVRGREEWKGGWGDCNWTTVQPVETELFWGPRLAPRSFVHPFVAVSNKNYDRLSHMLSLRRGPDAQMPTVLCSSLQFSAVAAVLKNRETSVGSREWRVECRESQFNTGIALSVSTLCWNASFRFYLWLCLSIPSPLPHPSIRRPSSHVSHWKVSLGHTLWLWSVALSRSGPLMFVIKNFHTRNNRVVNVSFGLVSSSGQGQHCKLEKLMNKPKKNPMWILIWVSSSLLRPLRNNLSVLVFHVQSNIWKHMFRSIWTSFCRQKTLRDSHC